MSMGHAHMEDRTFCNQGMIFSCMYCYCFYSQSALHDIDLVYLWKVNWISSSLLFSICSGKNGMNVLNILMRPLRIVINSQCTENRADEHGISQIISPLINHLLDLVSVKSPEKCYHPICVSGMLLWNTGSNLLVNRSSEDTSPGPVTSGASRRGHVTESALGPAVGASRRPSERRVGRLRRDGGAMVWAWVCASVRLCVWSGAVMKYVLYRASVERTGHSMLGLE